PHRAPRAQPRAKETEPHRRRRQPRHPRPPPPPPPPPEGGGGGGAGGGGGGGPAPDRHEYLQEDTRCSNRSNGRPRAMPGSPIGCSPIPKSIAPSSTGSFSGRPGNIWHLPV